MFPDLLLTWNRRSSSPFSSPGYGYLFDATGFDLNEHHIFKANLTTGQIWAYTQFPQIGELPPGYPAAYPTDAPPGFAPAGHREDPNNPGHMHQYTLTFPAPLRFYSAGYESRSLWQLCLESLLEEGYLMYSPTTTEFHYVPEQST